MSPMIERRWRTASTMLPVPASPLERIIAAPSEMRRSASPRFVAPHTNGTSKANLSMWWASSAGVSTSLSSTKSTASDCRIWASTKWPMRALAITGIDTAAWMPSIISGIAHPGDAAVAADVGRHALERHHRAGAGVLGDLGVVGRDDVHDDAALEHLGEAPLDRERPGRALIGEVMASMLTTGHPTSPLVAGGSLRHVRSQRQLNVGTPSTGSASSTHVRPGLQRDRRAGGVEQGEAVGAARRAATCPRARRRR